MVQECFGEFEDVSANRDRHGARVWKYGDIQVGFDGDRVAYIELNLWSESRPAAGWGTLELDPGPIRGDLSVEAFTEWLSQWRCEWRTLKAPWPDCRYIESAPGVHSIFRLHEAGSGLEKIIAVAP